MSSQILWTREELILAFNLYLKLPFGKLHTRTPEVGELASITGRTVNSIAIRLTNFAACDPYHKERGVKGMQGGVKQCQPIWDEFFTNQSELLFLSEKILAERQNTSIEIKYDEILKDISHLKGETVIREVKTRVNQSVFREIVLVNYHKKCAITGIDIPELLFASHIIPWSKNENERLNPENGICLSATFDKAFDKGFIGIDTNFNVLFSEKLKNYSKKPYFENEFLKYEGQKINSPEKYLPKKEFLEYHLDTIFNK